MTGLRKTALIVAVMALAGTACSVDDGDPKAGAPEIADPLEVEQFDDDPCRLLSSVDLAAAGMSGFTVTPGPKTAAASGCDVSMDVRADNSFTVLLDHKNPEGLSAYYTQKSMWGDGLKRLPDIEGHPAVHAYLPGQPEEGRCQVAVGVRDDRALIVHAAYKDGDACEAGAKVATVAVKNLKAKQ